MATQHQSHRVPLIIKSKYFGQYQPQLYIASKSKSKQKNKKLSLQKQKQDKYIGIQKTFEQQLLQKRQNSTKSKQKKQPISLQYFLRTRKKNNVSNGSACQKIFNWIQKRVIKIQFIEDARATQNYFDSKDNQFASKIRKISYNLYIIKKTGKTLSYEQFPELGTQSVKISKPSKENVIQQIQQQKRNSKQYQFFNGNLIINSLKTISESQNQYLSSKIQKNDALKEFNYKSPSQTYQEFVKNFDFQKNRIEQTSNTLNYGSSKKTLRQNNEQLQFKQSLQVSLNDHLKQENKELKQFHQEIVIQSKPKDKILFTQLTNKVQSQQIKECKNILIDTFRTYKKETAVCYSDNFIVNIFAYEIQPKILKTLQICQLAEEQIQQQHQNYDPFDNSHRQMTNIIANNSNNFLSNFRTAPKISTQNQFQDYEQQADTKMVKNSVINQNNNKQKVYRTVRPQTIKPNQQIQSKAQKIESYYFSEKIITNQNQNSYQTNQRFTFDKIISNQAKVQDKRIQKDSRRMVSPFYSKNLQDDIRMNRFTNQIENQQKLSQCSSKKSSKPKVTFHYLSPNQPLLNQNLQAEIKFPNEIQYKSSKAIEQQQQPKVFLQFNSNLFMQKMQNKAQNNLINNRFQSIDNRNRNNFKICYEQREQSVVRLPLAKYRSQSGFVQNNQYQIPPSLNRNYLLNQNKQYFPPHQNKNYVTVSSKIENNLQKGPYKDKNNNIVRQSQFFTVVNHKYYLDKANQAPKKRARSLNQKLLVTCAKHLII